MKTLIAAALLLALAVPAHAASKGEWFLILDTWFCDVHDCGEGKPADDDFVTGATFATKAQCLAEGKRPIRLAPVYKLAEDTGDVIGRISPRCEWAALETTTAGWTATPAQWKDIHALQIAFFRCGGSATDDPELKEVCALSSKLQDKLAKQGFCTYKHILVGRLAWHGAEEDRVYLGSKGEKHCYALHEPTR